MLFNLVTTFTLMHKYRKLIPDIGRVNRLLYMYLLLFSLVLLLTLE